MACRLSLPRRGCRGFFSLRNSSVTNVVEGGVNGKKKAAVLCGSVVKLKLAQALLKLARACGSLKTKSIKCCLGKSPIVSCVLYLSLLDQYSLNGIRTVV